MKILFPVPDGMPNPHIQELASAINNYTDAQAYLNLEEFWHCRGDYDIVHIQWPESLTGWKFESKINRQIEEILAYWKKRAIIVNTCHNLLPHNNESGEAKRLYDMVYHHSDAIIHLAGYSRTKIQEAYPEITAQQVVIPRLTYACYPDQVSREQARSFLKIPQDAFVMLSFGMLRHVEEKKLLLNAFKWLKHPQKMLLTPWWSFSSDFMVRQLEKIYYKIHPSYHFQQRHIPDEEVQYYFNAADMLFLPRIKHFNSANVILAFSFGKVVIGPRRGNIGEILSATGNPVYDHSDRNSVRKAVNQVNKDELYDLGRYNRDYALKNWAPAVVANHHCQLYRKLA